MQSAVSAPTCRDQSCRLLLLCHLVGGCAAFCFTEGLSWLAQLGVLDRRSAFLCFGLFKPASA